VKRSPMPKRSKPMKRTKLTPKDHADNRRRNPIKPVSDRRAAQSSQRRDVVAEVIARDGRCMARAYGAPEQCMGALVAHEVVKRSQMRDAHLDVENCLAVCWRHNSWIEDEPKLAKELGLMRSNWEDR
jgi:hypothetical protein